MVLAEVAAGLDLAQISQLGPIAILAVAIVALARVVDTMVTRAFAQADARKAEKAAEEGRVVAGDPVVTALTGELRRLLPGGNNDVEQRLRALETQLAELRGERRARITGTHQRAEIE